MLQLEQEALATHEKEQATRRIKAWKDSMHGGVQAVSAWVRRKRAPPIQPTVMLETGAVGSMREATAAIKSRWQCLWRAHAASNEERDSLAKDMAQFFPAETHEIEWTPPSLEAITNQVRKASSGAGPCGWHGQEIRHLPFEALEASTS